MCTTLTTTLGIVEVDNLTVIESIDNISIFQNKYEIWGVVSSVWRIDSNALILRVYRLIHCLHALREFIFFIRRTFTLKKRNEIRAALLLADSPCVNKPHSGLNRHQDTHDTHNRNAIIWMTLLLSLKWCIYVSGFLLDSSVCFLPTISLALQIIYEFKRSNRFFNFRCSVLPLLSVHDLAFAFAYSRPYECWFVYVNDHVNDRAFVILMPVYLFEITTERKRRNKNRF